MDFLSHKVRPSDLIAGDHIYAYRAGYSYSHHGIYVGKNKVIHFNDPIKGKKYCSDQECGSRRLGSGVFKSCLDCFLNEKKLRRYQYGIKKMEYKVKRRGTCTPLESDGPEIVIFRATYLFDHGFGKYDLTKNNCEDFALYCKTGLLSPNGCSAQVRGYASLIYGSGFVLSSVVALASGGPVLWAAVTSFNVAAQSAIRITSIPDMFKVEVEGVPTFHAQNK